VHLDLEVRVRVAYGLDKLICLLDALTDEDGEDVGGLTEQPFDDFPRDRLEHGSAGDRLALDQTEKLPLFDFESTDRR
jgi:hypothetical protein